MGRAGVEAGDCLSPRSAEEAVYEGMMAGLQVWGLAGGLRRASTARSGLQAQSSPVPILAQMIGHWPAGSLDPEGAAGQTGTQPFNSSRRNS